MSAARAMQFTRPRTVRGRSRSNELVDAVKTQLAEAVAGSQWGLAHRLLHALELLATGHTDATWNEAHVQADETWQAVAFRSRKDEEPPQFGELLTLLDRVK